MKVTSDIHRGLIGNRWVIDDALIYIFFILKFGQLLIGYSTK